MGERAVRARWASFAGKTRLPCVCVDHIESTVVGRNEGAEALVVREPGSGIEGHVCVHNGGLVLQELHRTFGARLDQDGHECGPRFEPRCQIVNTSLRSGGARFAGR